jgi:16S rRNA (uracil1498-N3)-methyltransferase
MVFVDDLDRPELVDADRRHLERSLRVRPGTPVTVADGAGSWRTVRFGPAIEPDGDVVTEPRPEPELVVAFAPVKGDRSDLIVQKLTELGIDRIVPLLTERSVVRWDGERAARNRDRHDRIVREAAMQSRNPWPPIVEAQMALADFMATRPAVVLADPDGGRGADDQTAVAIGPEGGFAPAELAGRDTIRLPGRILRTETAAIAAGVVLTARRG